MAKIESLMMLTLLDYLTYIRDSLKHQLVLLVTPDTHEHFKVESLINLMMYLFTQILIQRSTIQLS